MLKKWWNEFRQDLLFNLMMIPMAVMIYILAIACFVIAIKEVIKVC